MVQMNPTVGDLDGNVRRITAWIRQAKKAKADLVVFPELAITGYPPEDLLLKPRFVAANRRALQEMKAEETAIPPLAAAGGVKSLSRHGRAWPGHPGKECTVVARLSGTPAQGRA